jgi:hypothetical protein
MVGHLRLFRPSRSHHELALSVMGGLVSHGTPQIAVEGAADWYACVPGPSPLPDEWRDGEDRAEGTPEEERSVGRDMVELIVGR